MAIAPAAPEGVYGAALLFYLLYWAIALGTLWLWMATFHHLFMGIAKALTFKIGFPHTPSKTIHLGNWALTIDHSAQQLFSDAAVGAELLVGKFWHNLADTFWATSHAISAAAAATLDFGHYVIHDYVPNRIKADLGPLWNKSNKAAAVAAATAAGLAALKKEQRSGARHQAQTNKVAKTETKHAEHTAKHAKAVADTAATSTAGNTKVITQVIDVPSLPVPFGRTAKQLFRLAKKHEAIIGATVFAAAMANVLGLPSPRCLTKGPLGRISRRLCGMSTNALNDLLSLLADVFIISEICEVLPYLEQGFTVIAEPLVGLIGEAGAALCGGDFDPPPDLAIPALSLPALVGATTVEV